MRIPNEEIPIDAVAVLPAEMRRCDTLNLVAEKRLHCRLIDRNQSLYANRFLRSPRFEYRFVGGSVGWRDVVPGYMAEFFIAGLVEQARELRDGWFDIELTQAGEFLFSVWYRDRDRRRAAGL